MTKQYLNINSEDVQYRLVAENKFAFAIPSNMPIVPGHLVVCPKRPVVTINELTNEEVIAILELISKLKLALNKAFSAKGFNFAWNEGKIAGQSLDHLHVHMLPRKEGDVGVTEYEPRKFLYRPGSRAESPAEEIQLIAEKLRQRL